MVEESIPGNIDHSPSDIETLVHTSRSFQEFSLQCRYEWTNQLTWNLHYLLSQYYIGYLTEILEYFLKSPKNLSGFRDGSTLGTVTLPAKSNP